MPHTQAKSKKWNRIAAKPKFRLFQSSTDPDLFEVSWKRSDENYGRRRFRANTPREALDEAPYVAGLCPRMEQREYSLKEAFDLALALSRRNAKGRRDWRYEVERFLEWLVEEHPECENWSQLTRLMVREYLITFDGKADNTKRLAIQPIRQTSGFMAREFGLPNHAEKLGIGSKPKTTPRMVYLTDVLDFLDYLKTENPRLEAGVALQALSGLRVTEAIRLTWDRVDLEAGLIEISGITKNDPSKRVIPVAGRVLESLKTAQVLRCMSKVRYVREEPVLIDGSGHRYRNHDAYYLAFSRSLKRWNPKIGWSPKDMRKCLSTMSEMRGVRTSLWKQYEGRAAEDVVEKHYLPRLTAVSRGEKEELERRMNTFRKIVIAPLEEAIAESLLQRKADFKDSLNSAESQVPLSA